MTINGNSESWHYKSLRIVDLVNGRSTGSMRIASENTIEIGQTVIITDGATRIFGGRIIRVVITSPKGTLVDGDPYIEYDLTIADYNTVADRAKKLAITYVDTTLTNIINDTSTDRSMGSILAAEGITIGDIADGDIVISQAVFNYISVASALNYIKTVTGMNWNIDYSGELTLFYNADNLGTLYDDDNTQDMQVNIEYEEYRNAQIIKAGKDTTSTQTEVCTPAPDGTSREFFVRFPIAEKPQVWVSLAGGAYAQVDPSDVGILGIDTGKKWYWNKGVNKLSQDTSEVVLASGDFAKGIYKGLIPIIVYADNPTGQNERQTVEGGTGIYEVVEDLSQIDSRQAAMDYANGLLTKYADIPEYVYIDTLVYQPAGKIVPIQSTRLGINGEYLITECTIADLTQDTLHYRLKCASGDSLGSWVEFFRKLAQQGSKYVIRENEVLVLVNNTVERISMTGHYNIGVTYAMYPAEDLYPAETLYPNGTNISEEDVYD